MANKIKTVIWDMGGVILRSEDWNPRRQLASQHNMTLEMIHDFVFNGETGKLATLGQMTEDEHWKRIADQLNLGPGSLKEFQDQFWDGDRLDYELANYIRSLKPNYTTALLSNAWTNARHVLTNSKPCIDAFHVAVFSCEVGMMKPDSSIYKYILRLTSTEPEAAIFVDDAPENIEAANRMGIHGVLFKNARQAVEEVKSILNEAGTGS